MYSQAPESRSSDSSGAKGSPDQSCESCAGAAIGIPGSITKDGQPIVGGLDIDLSDFAFAEKIYPKVVAGLSLKTSSTVSSAGSGEGVGATILDFSHGELTRITLNRPALGS